MSIRLTLVRHGRPDGSWGRDADPASMMRATTQAAAMADTLAPIGPLPVVVSPLRRTRETAAPLLDRWRLEPVIDPAVGELTAPTDLGVGPCDVVAHADGRNRCRARRR